MKSGTRLVLVLLGAAVAVALLRALCVPVGSFRAGLDRLTWGVPADSVAEALGAPNEICLGPGLEPPETRGSGAGEVRAALQAATAERWIYSERPPPRSVPRSADPACRAPLMATELGFDAAGRLRWIVRETGQTPVAFDPALVVP